MKKRVIIGMVGLCLLMVVGYGQLFAQSGGDVQSMQAGNQLYQNGQFPDAAQIYQQVVDQGFEDASLYYNLGNAYFKSGDLGRAILYYVKAARLNPRDGDIQDNLRLARAQRIDQYEHEADFLTRVTQTLGSWLTLNELAIISLVLWFALILSLIAFFSRESGRVKEGLGYGVAVLALVFVASLAALVSQLYVESNRPAAVIIADEVDVQGGPGSGQVVEFTLHSGAEVRILEERGSWSRLELPGGQLEGWVPVEAVEKV